MKFDIKKAMKAEKELGYKYVVSYGFKTTKYRWYEGFKTYKEAEKFAKEKYDPLLAKRTDWIVPVIDPFKIEDIKTKFKWTGR